MNSNEPQKTVFLDRDGTLIEEVNFLSRVEELRLFPFTRGAVDLLKSSGFRLIVITNQSGIDRGLFDAEAMHAIHRQIQHELDNAIDAFYFCPHVPEAGCNCRKPNLGMIEAAGRDLPIDMSSSWCVGDKDLDVEIGHNAGLRTVLVETGYGRDHAKILKRMPDRIVANLLEAARYITEGD
jgi:D-glycero-D-manno-heptose 1,7-bisphosphate phosphatase